MKDNTLQEGAFQLYPSATALLIRHEAKTSTIQRTTSYLTKEIPIWNLKHNTHCEYILRNVNTFECITKENEIAKLGCQVKVQ